MSLKDLGTGTVDKICQLTGHPMDSNGHYLDFQDPRTGKPVKDWHKRGTSLYNLTSPYGHLHFCVGSGDDFYCFDYCFLQSMHEPEQDYVILDAAVNSETGGFIDNGGYELVKVEEYDNEAFGMIDQALTWCFDSNIRHTKKGWNQDPYYFARAVALGVMKNVGSQEPTDFSDRQLRFGGKRINLVCGLDIAVKE